MKKRGSRTKAKQPHPLTKLTNLDNNNSKPNLLPEQNSWHNLWNNHQKQRWDQEGSGSERSEEQQLTLAHQQQEQAQRMEQGERIMGPASNDESSVLVDQKQTSTHAPVGSGASESANPLLAMLYPPVLAAAHASSATFVILIAMWMYKYNGQNPAVQGFAWETGNKKLFNYHPVFMSAGFGFCLTEAILSFHLPLRHVLNKTIHFIFHVFAWIFAAIGLTAVFKFHNDFGIKNMYSTHSWMGMMTVSLYGFQFLLGFMFAAPLDIVSKNTRRMFVPIHQYLGVSTFVFAIATMAAGIAEKMAFNKTGPDFGSEFAITQAANVVLWLWVLTLPAAVVLRQHIK